MLEARTIDAEDLTINNVHLGPQNVGNVSVRPGANVYPVALKANAAGRMVAVSETFSNAAWKSLATVIVPARPTQRPVLANVIKSELQAGSPFAFTADLQPFANTNTNAATTDSPPYSIQLNVSNCAQACNVYFTLM